MLKKNTDNKYNIIESLVRELKLEGFNIIIGVPCSMLEGFISHPEVIKNFYYICATSEGEAVAIAAGATLAGQKAIVFCQNSGLGNMVNPITSLTNIFKLPILYLVSYRGMHSSYDAPQHQIMGQITFDLLSLLQIELMQFPKHKEDITNVVETICRNYDMMLSTCLIIDEKLSSSDTPFYQGNIKRYDNALFQRNSSDGIKTDRINILRIILNYFPDDFIYISTTGDTSRDLYEIKDTQNNFYMVGSMGYASSLGLGISLFTENKVVILDGDGALLMHMGNMSTIGTYGGKNLLHIVLNNNVYSTTGGQYNSSLNTDLASIAKSCNYLNIIEADQNNLERFLEILQHRDGPSFLEIKIKPSGHTSSNRPTISPVKNAQRLMQLLKK